MNHSSISPETGTGLKIVANGGGAPFTQGELAVRLGLEMTGLSKPNVLIIPTPKRTEEAWGKTIPETVEFFGDTLGLPTNLLHEFDGHKDTDAMHDKVEGADFVYTAGGDTLYLMDVLRRHRLDIALAHKALSGNVTLAGASAGAILPMQWGHSDSLSYRPETEASWDYIRVDGLDLVHASLTPHYSNTDERLGARSDKYLQMLNSVVGSDTRTGFGLDNYASLVVSDGLVRPFTPHANNQAYEVARNPETGEFESRLIEPGETFDLQSL